jgi:hypothetical protein
MDVEDILNDALSSVFDDHVRADPAEEGVVRYGPLVLRVAPKVGFLGASPRQSTVVNP